MNPYGVSLAVNHFLPAMADAAIERVRKIETEVLRHEQVEIVTRHVLHAGMYARTVTLPAGAVIAGAEVKRATILIVNGDVAVAIGEDKSIRLTGYHVLTGSARRKQAFVAFAETDLTMVFPTAAETVEQAEAEFTDEVDKLASRRGENIITITGETV